MTAMIVRSATPGDAEALTALAMLSKQSNGYDDAFMAACIEELRVTPDLLRAHEYWVAQEDRAETICGFVSLHVDADLQTGDVHSFFIHPDWQRRGIGLKLWAAPRQSACAQRLRLLRLDADPASEGFYLGLGFRTVGRAASGSIPGRTLPHMQMDFPA